MRPRSPTRIPSTFRRTSSIQNDPTPLRSSDETVLSASSYSGPLKTSADERVEGVSHFRTFQPTIQLQTSRSVETSHDNDYETFAFKVTNPDESSLDSLTSSKHVEHFDGNNIEVKPGEYYRITPTRSDEISGEGQGAPQGRGPSSEPRQPFGTTRDEAGRHPGSNPATRRGRQEGPRIYKEDSSPPILQTVALGTNRQANPDIQDIITGIVKLLNGNVNVAANTVRPHKPVQATRINNRGPPRISDLPPLPPDFDTPGMNPPPPPAPDRPYPFEKPPAPDRPSINQLPPERPIRPFIGAGSISEGLVPQGNRPWNRPYRPGGTRRPIPAYKPMPPQDINFYENESSPSEKPPRPSSQKPSYPSSSESHENAEIPSYASTPERPEGPATTNSEEEVTRKPPKYRPPMKGEKVVAENTLILGSDPKPIPIPNHSSEDDENEPRPSAVAPRPSPPPRLDQGPGNATISSPKTQETSEKNVPLKTTEKKSSPTAKSTDTATPPESSTSRTMTTLKIETSSSVNVIEPTGTIAIQETRTKNRPPLEDSPSKTSPSSATPGTSPLDLEPSRPSLEDTKSTFTSTQSLASSLPPKTSSHTIKSTHTPHSKPSETRVAKPQATERYSYRPRPGIVLDDTLDYTGNQGLVTQRPYAPPRHPQIGDIFDVTVSAIQGPGGGAGESVRVPVNVPTDVILTSAVEGQGFVSIDGKRTYLNLFDNTDQASSPSNVAQPQPTRTQAPPIVGTGFAVPQPDVTSVSPRPNGGPRRPTFHRRPTQPPVRIDTCIVGDTSTCDASQHEACATVQGVSACHCKPGYARLLHTLPCKKVVSIVVSIRVDRIYDWKVLWDHTLADKDSESYQTVAYEANRAIESAMSMTPFSDEYMGSLINSIYQGDVSQGQGGVFVNATLKLTYEPRTARPSLAGELQRHLLGVIHRRNNNIGNSAVYVDSPPGSISNLQDLDECASTELNDCHSSAKCINTWGAFNCVCSPGFKDPHKDEPNEAGRSCLSCPSSHCNNRGTCSYQANQMQCSCTGNYYGAQCEVDGEVLGVAIGASVAALIIIVLTLVCLVMWSRRWSREQKAVGSPVYGYMQGGIPGTLPGTLARVGSVGTLASVKQGPPTNLPPYMWAHINDHMATANVYATEPMGPTRPSSAMFGYPTMSMHGTLRPVPLPRLQAPPRPRQRHNQPEPDSSDSEPQDKDRADLIPQNSGFHVPRPKSRSSLANQSGIYYDVEYDQGDAQHLSKNNIPMSTYSMARPYYRT
ncbi:uncharacterized protein pwn isoform X2 [Venturia canescens]|uniref:uncharacterized protein pwn isoform X2 n=1 Tax=Venturia canescens TaxID=32260 RepID=UPI001C9D54A6|nr:uncharacterized protein LOC122418544 isoform X2 [Venturia canescens]